MKSHGLYRDDGLVALKATGREFEKLKQKLVKLFKEKGLKILTVVNVSVAEYLDVKLNLKGREYRAFKKPNDRPLYVNSQSNHPPTVIKSLPSNINNRLNQISCNEKVFNEEKQVYQDALTNSGYSHELKYSETGGKKVERFRQRHITYYNPPWSSNVKTPVGHIFLGAVNKFFPKGHDLHKYFNRNTLKVSYCTSKNLKGFIDAHNRKILHPKDKAEERCNCKPKFKNECPLPGKCTAANVIYQADITEEGSSESKQYIGQTARSFKDRFYEHKMAIKTENSPQSTALSKYIWKLKKAGKNYTIKWSIKNRAFPYKSGSKRCQICLKEKTAICLANPRTLLNNRTELLHKCIHLINFELRKNSKGPS